MKKTIQKSIKRIPKTALAIAFSSVQVSASFASDYIITSEISGQTLFTESGQTITISGEGNLTDTRDIALIKAHSTSITGVKLIIDTNHSKGISNISTTNPAINISGGANLASLDLKSGNITSHSVAILLNASGTTDIKTSAGTTISGDVMAINGGYLGYSDLKITNAGTISSDNIAISDNGPASSTLSIVNSGTISGEFSVRSVSKDELSRDVSIVNSGTMEGRMVFIGKGTSSSSIINSGNINGNIESRSSDKMTVINNGGSINGNITFATNADSSFTLNGGSINGNLSVSVASQKVNLNSGSFNGDINLADGAILNLASTVMKGSIDSNSDHSATVNLTNNNTLNSDTILGSDNGLSAVNISSNKTINANGTIRTKDLNIASNSTLNIGSNNIYTNNTALAGNLNFGNISKTFNGNITGNGNGSINLNGVSHNIAGDLSLKNGDTLKIVINGSNSFGNVETSGSVSIDPNTNLAVAVNPSYSFIDDGSKYTIVKGGSGSNINKIQNSKININGSNSNQFSLVTFTTSSVNNNLILNANRKDASTITSDKSSQNAYNAINNIGSSATGELKSFQRYIDTSSNSTQVKEALTSITPQNNNGIKLSNINAIINSVKTAENRMDEIHLASNSSSRIPSVSNTVETSYNLKNDKRISGLSLGDDLENSGIWGQTFGTTAKQDNISNNDGYNSKSLGFAFGYDKEVIKNTRLGIATSYASSNVKSLDSLKNTNIDTYQLNIYSGHSFNKYFLDSIIGFAWNEYNSNRVISSINTSANATYNGQSYIAKVRGGMIKDLGNGFNITPEMSVNFVRNHTDKYTENGAGTINLNVKSTSSDFLEGRVGLNLGYRTIIGKDTKITPRITASYGYNFLNERQSTTSNFVGQTATFNSLSSKIDPKSLKLGSGIDIYSTSSTLISAEYIMEKRNNYGSHSGVLRVRFEF